MHCNSLIIERMANFLTNLPVLGGLAQNAVAMLRSKITVYNAASTAIQVSIEKELVSDEDGYFKIVRHELETWGRKAGTYQVSVLIGGESFHISLRKGAENVRLTIRGFEVYDLE